MNVLLFDSQSESNQIWQELATSHGLRANVFYNADRLAGVASDADILIIDQSVLPHTFHASVASICRQHRSSLVIATGSSLRIDDAVDLMSSGAAWVFSKPLARGRVAAVFPTLVERVATTQAVAQEYEHLHRLFTTLTTREKDVLNYILVGTSNKDTARELTVSVRTIESRRAKVYRKLEANNIAELVRRIDRLESLAKVLGLTAIPPISSPPPPAKNGQVPSRVAPSRVAMAAKMANLQALAGRHMTTSQAGLPLTERHIRATIACRSAR